MSLSRTVTRRSAFALLLVATVGGENLYARRKERYLHLARENRHQAALLDTSTKADAEFRRYHLELARRYERAACRPWLRVVPLPPGLPHAAITGSPAPWRRAELSGRRSPD
jgi:hypothetical protein